MNFWVNGEPVKLRNPSPSVTLLDWLRETKALTGTHVGCAEGGCGSCTVALVDSSGRTLPINSCLRRLCAVDGCHVVTTQGLGNVKTGVHPIQAAIADGNGSQCGFCTPGWVMNMYALLESNPSPTPHEVEQNFDGNLCRCTGYRPILSSFGEFADGGKCCGQSTSVPLPAGMFNFEHLPLHFTSATTGEEYYRPLTMTDLLAAKAASFAAQKKVVFLCGNTAVGVVKYLTLNPTNSDMVVNKVFIDLNLLPTLSTSIADHTGLTLGSTVSIAEMITQLEKVATPAFTTYAEHIKRVASVQIRSISSWAGNVMLCRESFRNADYDYFPSDLVLVLATAGATLRVVLESTSTSSVEMDVMTLMKTPGEILVLSVHLPTLPPNSLVKTYKMMRRHVFAVAIVNFGSNLTFDADGTVKTASVYVGGATSSILPASQLCVALVGKKLSAETLNVAIPALTRDMDEAPALTVLDSLAYKRHVAIAFLRKTFLAAAVDLPQNEVSALVPFTPSGARPLSSGSCDYGVDEYEAPVSTWITKQDAVIQATGEATYVSDQHVGAWFAQIVYSTTCNATLSGLDAQDALRMPGVKDFIAASAIPGQNCWAGDFSQAPGTDLDREKIFFEVNDKIPYVGAQLGLIVAETWAQACAGAKAVTQSYASAAPPVVSMADAARRGLTVSPAQLELTQRNGTIARMHRGAVLAESEEASPPGQRTSPLSVQGTLSTQAQIHFPLETHSTCAVPIDGDSMQIYVSGQCRDLEQSAVSLAIGVPRSRVNVVNSRVGGAYGGKILGQLASCCAVAVAAHKLRRPIRFQNERRADMQSAGARNAIDFVYDATFNVDGKIDHCDLSMNSDAGWISANCGLFMTMGASEADSVFNWTGGFVTIQKALLTNKPAVAAMRAPGSMQSALFSGAVIEHIARAVGKDVEDVMELNFYQEGDTSCITSSIVFGWYNFNYTLPKLWSQMKVAAQFDQRKAAVVAFNKQNKWIKKGISMAPAKLNMRSYSYLMGAHLTAYPDGTVHVSTGGVEMGQGLHTKVALVVAKTLGIPVDKVTAEGGDTRVCGNNAMTAGSGTSESCCNAAIEAAKELKLRLDEQLSMGISWVDALQAAVAQGMSLETEGWFDGIAFEPKNPIYAAYGVAVSEIMLDVMTGETRLDRVDLLMDLGTQLNAAVDMGQVQGGFVMTLGYLFTEETMWDKHGTQLFAGTWHYKVPTAYDIPVTFNVSLLKDSPNPNSIALNSKAVAEPAMSLVLSPYLAVKNAIYAAREEFGLGNDWFQLDVPVSPEAITTAIGLDLSGHITK